MKKNEVVKRLPPTSTCIKKLFALSGNICAFPDCNEPIISKEGIVVGDICHIEAAETNGARFNDKSDNEKRRNFKNLILMCKKHHKIIDEDEKTYTAKFLKELKKQHELKFKEININEKLEASFNEQKSSNKEMLNKITLIETTTISTNKVVQEIQQNLKSSFYMDLSNFAWYLKDKISEKTIKHLHKDIMKDYYPDYLRGVYRQEEAWIGLRGCTKENCAINTINPKKIQSEMRTFIADWNEVLNKKNNLKREEIILKLAKMHLQFIKIHPFHDGNGRIARVILIAQIFQLEKHFINCTLFTNKNEYYLALQEANNNDYTRLNKLIKDLYQFINC